MNVSLFLIGYTLIVFALGFWWGQRDAYQDVASWFVKRGDAE